MRRGPKKEDEEDSKNEVRKRPRVAKKEEEEDGANLEKGELSIEAAGEEWNQFRVESSELDLARPFGPFDGVVQKNLVDRYGKIAVYFVQNKFLTQENCSFCKKYGPSAML